MREVLIWKFSKLGVCRDAPHPGQDHLQLRHDAQRRVRELAQEPEGVRRLGQAAFERLYDARGYEVGLGLSLSHLKR